MALEFFHGFDNVSNAADMMRVGWTAATEAYFSTGRFGGVTKALNQDSPGSVEDETNARRQYVNLSGPLSRVIMGMTLRVNQGGAPGNLNGLPNIKNRLWKFMDGSADTNSNVQIGIGFGPSGTIRVWRGDTQILESDANALLVNTWHRVEADVTFHDTAGAVLVKVDGGIVINATGIDTQNTANPSVNVFRINRIGHGTGPSVLVNTDDLILMNDIDDGTNLHMMKGDLRADLIAPSADFQQQFSRSTGTTNWSLIDEAVLSTSDWVEGVAGLEDIYDLTDLGTLSLVHAIKVNMQAWRTGTTFFNATPKLYTNASNASLAAAVLSGTSAQYSRTQVLNPITGVAWTPAEINALRLGVAVT